LFQLPGQPADGKNAGRHTHQKGQDKDKLAVFDGEIDDDTRRPDQGERLLDDIVGDIDDAGTKDLGIRDETAHRIPAATSLKKR